MITIFNEVAKKQKNFWTVVDVVTTKEEQDLCRSICESVGAAFRVRPYESN